MCNLRYHETDRGVEVAAWLSSTLPNVRYSLHDYYVDASVYGGARSRGILIEASDDDEMTIHMRWEGQWRANVSRIVSLNRWLVAKKRAITVV
jgi:hypothetical protein